MTARGAILVEDDYWPSMEFRLCREFDRIEVCRRLGLFCDGLIPEDYSLDEGPPSVTGRIWIGDGQGRQEPWPFELRILGKAASRDLIGWQDQYPAEASVGWLEVDLEARSILMDPAEARREDTAPLRFGCPCCGYRTLGSRAGAGSHEVCEICFWADDPAQFRDWNLGGGANGPSLLQARSNFAAFGACDEEARRHVRAPTERDVRKAGWTEGS